MYVALEKYINQDHDKEWAAWETNLAVIESTIKKIPGVTTEVMFHRWAITPQRFAFRGMQAK